MTSPRCGATAPRSSVSTPAGHTVIAPANPPRYVSSSKSRMGAFCVSASRWSSQGLLLLVCLSLAGCGTSLVRNPVADPAAAAVAQVPGLGAARFWGDEVPRDLAAEFRRLMPNLGKLQGHPGPDGQPEVRVLALSGGGSDGAFGAGLLTGWTERGNRPAFELVTGISAGAIIAPFAYLGPGRNGTYDKQLKEIWTEYETNELVVAQILPGLLGGPSLASTAPLEALIAKYVDKKFMRAIAAEYRKGRILLIGTTNLDAQRPVVWNMGEIAVSTHPDALALFRKVIMASAALPGLFPPVTIPVDSPVKAGSATAEELHVDGGVTREVFVTPIPVGFKAFDVFYPVPPKRTIYIIKNGKLAPEFEVVKPTAVSIALRSIWTLTKSQNANDIYRIWRMARDAGASFNLAAVPDRFEEKPKQAFDPAYQLKLFEQGYQIGRSGQGWLNQPPSVKSTRR